MYLKHKLTYRTGSLLGLWWWYHMITKARCVCAINFERNKPETWKPQWLIMLTDRNLKPWIRLGSVWTSCFLIYPLKMVIFHSFLYVYQRVIELIYKNYPTYICIYFFNMIQTPISWYILVPKSWYIWFGNPFLFLCDCHMFGEEPK